MFKYSWLFVTALYSATALANVDLAEKKNRVEYLEKLSKSATSMNIEAFRRELKYEEQGLSLEQRAENEAQLLSEKIKLQVVKMYETSLLETGNSQEAVDEVKAAIERDINLVTPELQVEMRALALTALDSAQRGEITASEDLRGIRESMLEGVKQRSEYLNQEVVSVPLMISATKSSAQSSQLINKDKDKLVKNLVSEKENDSRISQATANLKSTQLTRLDSKINLQVKVNFLGVDVEAGPTISFNRQYVTYFDVAAEGLQTPIDSQGQFDFNKKDSLGRIILKNGKPVKRQINFVCVSSIKFNTEYQGSGSFSFMGIGGGVQLARDYANSAEIISRRVDVPETIGGKRITYNMLANLCHNDFMKARVTPTVTVARSLQIMMQNIVSGLKFSHPKTSCAVDSQCRSWFNNEVVSLYKRNNSARCVENAKEKYMYCDLRGREGQNCTVYNKNGRRVSGAGLEFTCDKGLVCKTQRAASLMFPAIGKCSKR